MLVFATRPLHQAVLGTQVRRTGACLMRIGRSQGWTQGGSGALAALLVVYRCCALGQTVDMTSLVGPCLRFAPPNTTHKRV